MMRLATTLTLFLGLACSAYAQSPRQVAEPAQSNAYEQTVPYRSMRGTTPDACAARCEADQVCQAWVLTPPTFSQAPKCQLRTTAAFENVHPAAATGVVERLASETRTAPQTSAPRDGSLAGAPVSERSTPAVRSMTPARARTRVETAPPQPAPVEDIPFSQRKITVESYPVGYEPAPARTAPAPQPKPAAVSTERPSASPTPAQPPATATPAEPAAPTTTTRTTVRTRTTAPAPASAREMVTTRADSDDRPAPPTAAPVANEPVPADVAVPARASTPEEPAPATPADPRTTAPASAPANRDHPWPGLRRPSSAQPAPAAQERPLPRRDGDGGRAYSIQGMETLPGDYEDNGGLQGRLPAGQLELPEEPEDEEDGDTADATD